MIHCLLLTDPSNYILTAQINRPVPIRGNTAAIKIALLPLSSSLGIANNKGDEIRFQIRVTPQTTYCFAFASDKMVALAQPL